MTTGRTNRIVVALLTSRFHWLLSRWLCVIDYHGRASGRRYMIPSQYVSDGGMVIVLVGKHDTKNWWRNFVVRPHPLRLCMGGTWLDATAIAVTSETDAEQTAALLGVYLRTYPRAAKLFVGETVAEMSRHACLVQVEIRSRAEADESA